MKLSRRNFLKGMVLTPVYFLVSSLLSKFKPWPTNPAKAENIPGGNSGGSSVILKAVAENTFLGIGDGKMHFTVPAELGGMKLVSAGAHVYTPSTKGEIKVQLHNATRGVDFLSTPLTIEANKKDSTHSAVRAVIAAHSNNLLEGDELRIDVDAAGSGAKGLEVRLGFGRAPGTTL